MNKCEDKCCICYSVNLDKLIYESKIKLDRLSSDRIKRIFHNFNCDKEVDEKIHKLNTYLWIMEDELNKHAFSAIPCLDCNELQCLAENVRKLTTNCDLSRRKDIQIDNSGVEAWIAKSGACVSRERWEKLVYEVFCDLNLEIEVDEKKCELDLNLMSVEKACDLAFEISSEMINCDLLFAIHAFKKNCDLGFTIKRTEEECELDFKILLEKIDCDLDLKAYIKLIECNLSFDVIKTIYENGCTVEITENGPVLNTMLNSYPLSSFNYSNAPNISALNRLGADLSNSKYAKDPQSFIDKINSDYK